MTLVSRETYDVEKTAQRIKELRKKKSEKTDKKETQNDLALVLGIKPYSYCRLENGKTALSIPALLRLCDHYDVSIDYMLCHTDNPDPSVTRSYYAAQLQREGNRNAFVKELNSNLNKALESLDTISAVLQKEGLIS